MTKPATCHSGLSAALVAGLILAAFEGSAGAQLSLQPAQVTFGTLQVGDVSSPTDITVQNLGGASFDIQSVALAGTNPIQFRLADPGRFTLNAGQMKVFTVSYAPISAGTHTASVVVTPVGFAAAQVKLSGIAVQPVLQLSTGQSPPNVLDFDQIGGPYYTGVESEPALVGLKVPSTGIALVIDRIVVSPDTDFRVTPVTTPSLTPGRQTTFSVYFKPSAAGYHSATASVFAVGVNSALATVTFKGTGISNPTPRDMAMATAADLSMPPRDGATPGGSTAEPSNTGCSIGGNTPAPYALLPLALLVALRLRRRSLLAVTEMSRSGGQRTSR